MRQGLAIVAVTVTVSVSWWPVFWRPQAAFAAIPSCPSSEVVDAVGQDWPTANGDFGGLRAPIENRTDGEVCTGSPEGASYAFIAVENSSLTSITYLGLTHYFDPTLGGLYCRFWQVGSSNHAWDCNKTSDHTHVYFEIVRFYDTTRHAYFYDLHDCGTGGGYSNCTSENDQQGAYSSAFGLLEAATIYGGSACTVKIMGASLDKQNFGTGSYPIEGKYDGQSWQTKVWYGIGPTCSHYDGSVGDSTSAIWDDRNTT